MKLLKLAVIALFTLGTVSNVSAQDENNPYVVGFGVNVVDFSSYPLNNTSWNFLPSVSRISGETYLEKGFSLQFSGTINKIEVGVDDVAVDELYWSADMNVKYDLNNLVGETSQWFDPYVYLGGGYVAFGDASEGMLNAGAGFNTWFNENLGLNLQTGYRKGFSDEVAEHWQSSLGLVFRFGGKDTDGDGVYDKKDACPEEAGLVEFNGCPDADNDGIKDSDDACPNVAGSAAMNGCPDTDGDGIADKDDMCVDAKGTKANKGCPDTDGDSVLDKDDKCTTTAGPAANGGCPWPDTDGDGVLDKDDNCNNEVGPASNNGCPLPIITEEAVAAINMSAKTILFEFDNASFQSGVSDQLDAIVAIMNKYPKATFLIEGHTDSIGTEKVNQKISDKRAAAVKAYFVEKGVDATRIDTKGFGESMPVAGNMLKAGRSLNRRVEIKTTNK
ncbi:MAG: Outer membrane porin F [Polaribacter sp. SA4-10]|nr:MAG: Outer membrane porin F [Polaribacter sp. SA4-10]